MEPAKASIPSVTQRDQWNVESQVYDIYSLFATIPRNAQSAMLELLRDKHMEFLSKVDPGYVTGSSIRWPYWANQWTMRWKQTPLTFLTVARIQMVDMVVDLARCLILPQLMLQSMHLLLWVVRNLWHQLIEINYPTFCGG